MMTTRKYFAMLSLLFSHNELIQVFYLEIIKDAGYMKHYFENYWGFIALGLWVGACLLFDLVRLDAYGLDEQAARGLLLNWSVSDNIVSPIVVFGVPDFRALLFLPVGIYWAGNMLAAKIFSLVICFTGIALLYNWAKRQDSKESALISASIFAISPVVIWQVDQIGAAPFLLMAFAVGAWLDQAYRAKPRYFGGWYFAQMLMVAIAITIHPIALAYPLALVWTWWRNGDEHKSSRHLYIGLAISSLIALAISNGWQNINWFNNPIQTLAQALEGSVMVNNAKVHWVSGLIITMLLIPLVIIDKNYLVKSLLGKMLLIALFIGLATGDQVWATFAFVILIFRWVAVLIRASENSSKDSLLGQRGLLIACCFIATTAFMLEAKAHAVSNKLQLLNAEDELIEKMVTIASDNDKPFRALSQWPARTMLATKRDVFPLEFLPTAIDKIGVEGFLTALHSYTHIVLAPNQAQNKVLNDRLSSFTHEMETLGVFSGGVIIEVRNHTVELRNYRPQMPNKPEDDPATSTEKTN